MNFLILLGCYFNTRSLEKGGSDMNKGDLVKEVAKVVGSKKGAQAAVDSMLTNIAGALKK